MKIIYCIGGTYNSAGMERVVVNKSNWLAAHGYDVVIVTTEQLGRPSFFPLNPKVRSIDLDINYEENNNKSVFNKLAKYPLKHFQHKRRLAKLLKNEHPDIVVSTFGNEVDLIATSKDGSRKVAEIHFTKLKRQWWRNTGLWRIINHYRDSQDSKIAGMFDRFVSLTNEDAAQWLGLKNVRVIHNANSFVPSSTSNPNSNKIIAVGRYDFQKGFDRLIDIWSMISSKFPDWRLEIVGDGIDRKQLEEQIHKLGLEKSVFLKSTVRNIEAEYASSSICVMTSRYEGLPMALLEAHSMGLPTVAYACKCGPSDIIIDGRNGYLIQEGDQEGFVEKLSLLMSDPELRATMGVNAKEDSKRFEEDVIMSKWVELFNELV